MRLQTTQLRELDLGGCTALARMSLPLLEAPVDQLRAAAAAAPQVGLYWGFWAFYRFAGSPSRGDLRFSPTWALVRMVLPLLEAPADPPRAAARSAPQVGTSPAKIFRVSALREGRIQTVSWT